jgi:hypothetical protein
MYGFSGSKSYALYLGATGQLAANDYNIYDVTLGTTQGVIASLAGTDLTSLAALRTSIGGEANSMAVPVMYKDSSATADLHLTMQEPTLRGSSAVSSTINTDFDGYTRTRYLIGADEVTPVMNISQQPSSTSKCEGESFTLTAALTTPVAFDDGVARSSTISYQWYKGSSAIAGATDASYTVSSSTTADAGSYTVRIFSSTIDSVVSNAAVVTINTLPNITQQPSDVSRCLGTLTTLSGAATGTGITYQWQKQNGASWSDVSGATGSTFTIPSMTAGDYGSYRFVVTGTCAPAATSNTATITQLTSTSISAQPSATPSSVCLGGSFTLSVTATASNIGYQWRRNGVSISGATNSTFTVTNAQLSDFATYSVAVSGDCGVIVSSNVAVTQVAATAITSQPSSTTPQVCLGAPFTVTVSATGASLGYQWQRNGTAITGATNSSFTVAAATLADFASYTVTVTGTCGAVNSQAVSIVQIPSTVITAQPASTNTLCSGSTLTLSVVATGANLSYQWQKQSGASFNSISGATASTYTIGSVAPTDAGTYRVVVTGTCGAVNSSNSVLVVNTPVSITAQPSWSFPNACTGETTTISMNASGTITSYQWQKFDGSSWQNLSGATSNSYTIASLTMADAGGYRIQIEGPCSPTTVSNQATLTVQQNVQINAQPGPQTACVGSSISYSVTTIGTVVGYQWEQDRLRNGSWTTIPGATSATYTKSGVTAADSGLYRVKVTGNCSAIPVVSSSASATIQSIYNITSQPSWPATPTNVGTVVSMSVGFTGSANFQWQRDQQRSGNWVNVGTNASVYSFTITSVADSGNYRCVVSGPCGAVTQNTNIVAVYTCQPPVVTNQPATPQPVCAGGAFSLSVAVNSNGQAVTYQWQLDATRTGSYTDIPGATNASYIKTNVQTSDDGMYRVQVTSACAVTPVYSNAVSFVVLSANLVLSHPSSATVCGGSNVTMSVSAGGASPSYQWFYNGAPMNVGQNPTAQTANLQLTNVTPGMAGSYRCFVTGPCSPNGVFSNIATLTVNTPVMQLQPQSQTGCVGTPVTFNVQVLGSGLAYQWRKNSVAIAGATDASYTIASPVVADAGTYSVVASNTCGTVTSANAVLTMTVPAAFTSQPSSQSICRGSNLTLSVGINSDATTPTYQWRLNGSNLPLSAYPSANTPVLTINNIQATESGSYTCSVVTPCQPLGTVSAAAVVTVNPNTSISQQPSGTTVCEGNPVTFVVGAGGVSLSYQWLKDGSPIAGATNSIYIITNTVGSDNGSYSAVVSGTCAPTPITSNAATLVVNTNPRITAAPVADRAACQGSTVTFSTGASGTGLVYRWRFNGSTITGNASASTPTLVVTGITGANAGAYDCVITGSCSTTGVTTNAGTLTINTPVSISSQPASQIVCSRADVVFTVANVGTGAVYQWRYNGVSINGNPSAVTNRLTLSGVTTSNAGLYDVVISGTCNTVTSLPAALGVQNVLSITSQPEPSRICAGSTLQATVAATGTILGYQWQKDGVNIPGQNSATLTISGASVAQSGGYRCVISGSAACGTSLQVSNTVEMIVGTAATITKQPSNVAVSFGSTVSAQVDASGLGYGVNNTLQYSWFKGSTRLADGSRFSGTGTSVLTIRGVQPSDIGNDYYVVVSGVCGNTTSNQFALFVPAVNITGQPQAAELCAGQSTVFSVVAVPNPSTSQLSYQWFRGTTRLSDGPNVTGSATSSMTVSNVSATDAGDYTCEITVQPGGSRVTSSIAKLTVNTQPSITAQPADQAVCDGSALNLSVTGAGGSLQYQWKKGGTDIGGATASSYTVSASSAADAGTYTVSVRNGCGTVTSQSVTVSISTKPTITTQPAATQTVVVGGTLTLNTSATGSGTLKYQWKLNGNAIAGATNATYTKSPASKNDEGTYVCEVTNDCGAVSTSNAAVSISTTSITDAEVYGYMLGTPEPNPMGEVASLKIRVPVSGAVRLDLSDMSGRVVATLIDGVLDAGEHTEVLSASRNNLGSGVYTLRLVTSEGYVTTKRLVIVR